MRIAILSVLALGMIPLMANTAEAGDRHRHHRHGRSGFDFSIGVHIGDHDRYTSVRYNHVYSPPVYRTRVYREPCYVPAPPPVVYYPSAPVIVHPAPVVVHPAPVYHRPYVYSAPSSCYTPSYYRTEVRSYYQFSR